MKKKIIAVFFLVFLVSESRASDVLGPTLQGSLIGVAVGAGAGTLVGIAADNFRTGSIIFGSCVVAGTIGGLLLGTLGKNSTDSRSALIHFDQKSSTVNWSVPALVPLLNDERDRGIFMNLFTASLF